VPYPDTSQSAHCTCSSHGATACCRSGSSPIASALARCACLSPRFLSRHACTHRGGAEFRVACTEITALAPSPPFRPCHTCPSLLHIIQHTSAASEHQKRRTAREGRIVWSLSVCRRKPSLDGRRARDTTSATASRRKRAAATTTSTFSRNHITWPRIHFPAKRSLRTLPLLQVEFRW
jgi:hypothetical protein